MQYTILVLLVVSSDTVTGGLSVTIPIGEEMLQKSLPICSPRQGEMHVFMLVVQPVIPISHKPLQLLHSFYRLRERTMKNLPEPSLMNSMMHMLDLRRVEPNLYIEDIYNAR